MVASCRSLAAGPEGSARRIRIPASIVAFLVDCRAKQQLLAWVVSTNLDRGLVFPRDDGGMKRPSTVTGGFTRLCAALKIEDGHRHCLRLAFATEMLRAGEPVKVVSEVLGHANAATTQALSSQDYSGFATTVICAGGDGRLDT